MHVRYLLALLFSLALHGLLFMQWQSDSDQSSSKGSAQVLLLEDNSKWQTAAPEVSAQKQTAQSAIHTSKQQQQQQTTQQQTESNTIQSKKRVEQSTKAGQDKNLAGKALSAKETYRNQVVQHLLSTMEEAPTLGEVAVSMWLMPSGIAYKIEVTPRQANKRYEQWVRTKILSANPYPPIPKNISQSNLQLSFNVQHLADD